MDINNRSILILFSRPFTWVLICLLASLTACSDNLSQLDRIKSRGSLRVALITAPPLYFPDESLIKGYDYEIIASYAKAIGVKREK